MKKSIVGLLAIAMVFGFAGTTLAADWNFYGSARLEMFWETLNDDASGVLDTNSAKESDTDLDYKLQGNSRVGANVKAGDVAGRFELGLGSSVGNRLIYGTWNFGAGSLLVGQAYTPIDTLYSGQANDGDNGLLFEGMTYEGRKPMLQLAFSGLKVALVVPNATGQGSEQDVMVPKVEVSYDFKADMFSVGGYGGFVTYDKDTVPATSDSFVGGTYTAGSANKGSEPKTVTSYLVGVRFKVTPGMFYVNGNVYYAKNAGDYGIVANSKGSAAAADAAALNAAGDVEDAKTVGGAVAVGAKFSDMLKIEGGLGYVSSEIEVDSVKTEGTTMAYYVQLPITLAKGVFVVPEFSYYDFGDKKVTGSADAKMGNKSAFGAKFQINF